MIFSYLTWAFLAAVCISAIVSYVRRRARYKPLRKFPGNPEPTFFASLTGIISWMIKYNKSNILKHHPDPVLRATESQLEEAVRYQDTGMHCNWYGPVPVVYIYKAEIVKLVLCRSSSNQKSDVYKLIHNLFGNGLMTSNGEKWRQRRKLINPCFSYGMLENHLPVFHQQSLELIQKLKSLSEEDHIHITPLILLYSFAVMCDTLMGVSIGDQNKKYLEVIKAEEEITEIFYQRLLFPWLRSDILFGLTDMGRRYARNVAIRHNFRNKMIKERKAELLSDINLSEANDGSEFCQKRHKVLLDHLLELNMNGQLSDEDILDEIDTFLSAGYVPTGYAIVYALYCIGLYPEVQGNISDELDAVFDGDVNRPVTYDDTRKMKYLGCVIKESQRIFPPGGYFGRKIGEDIQITEDFKIPKNTTVTVSLLALHRNPEFFPNPEVFDPERFNPENARGRHPYAFIPFSIGPRNCIGQKFAMLKLKIVLCNILRHFTVLSLVPLNEFHVKAEIALKPAQEVKMKFFPKH